MDDVDRAGTANRLVENNVDQQVERLETGDDIDEDVVTVGVVRDFQDIPGRRGEVHTINVDGETSVDAFEDEHPEIEVRIEQLWEY